MSGNFKTAIIVIGLCLCVPVTIWLVNGWWRDATNPSREARSIDLFGGRSTTDDVFEIIGNPDPDLYFKSCDGDLHLAARRIRDGKPLSPDELAGVGGKADRRCKDDISLLFFAGWVGNVAAIDQLLGAGADPMQLDHPGQSGTSFLETIASAPKTIATREMALLLQHGVNPDSRAGYENLPLIDHAVVAGNWGTAKLLLDHGANPWAETQTGQIQQTALTAAAQMQDHFFINDVIDRGGFARATPQQLHQLMDSIDRYWLKDDHISRSVVFITRRIADVSNVQDDPHAARILSWGDAHLKGETLTCVTPLSVKLRSKDYHIAFDDPGWLSAQAHILRNEPLTPTDLAALKGKVNARWRGSDDTLLNIAMQEENYDAIAKLLSIGADPYMERTVYGDGQSLALELTRDMNRGPRYLDLYLQYGGDPDYRLYASGAPLIARAALDHQTDQFQRLLEAGADVWAEELGEEFGRRTAIALAARYENYDLIRMALNAGAFRSADHRKLSVALALLNQSRRRLPETTEIVQPLVREIRLQSRYPGDSETAQMLAPQ